MINEKNLELVQEMLDQSKQYGLSAEVVLSTIILAKQYPSASIAMLLLQGLETWDCLPEVTEIDYWDGDGTDNIQP